MASMGKELEERLLEVGNRLASPSSAVKELLALLDVLNKKAKTVSDSSLEQAATKTPLKSGTESSIRHDGQVYKRGGRPECRPSTKLGDLSSDRTTTSRESGDKAASNPMDMTLIELRRIGNKSKDGTSVIGHSRRSRDDTPKTRRNLKDDDTPKTMDEPTADTPKSVSRPMDDAVGTVKTYTRRNKILGRRSYSGATPRTCE